jgi:hypothetical protein
MGVETVGQGYGSSCTLVDGCYKINSAMVLFFAASVYTAAQDRFVSKLTLPTVKTVVVADGDFEARSIGSVSLRLHEDVPAPDTTFFISGLIHARDGVIEKVILADVDETNGKKLSLLFVS